MLPLPSTMRNVEKHLIMRALRTSANQRTTANILQRAEGNINRFLFKGNVMSLANLKPFGGVASPKNLSIVRGAAASYNLMKGSPPLMGGISREIGGWSTKGQDVASFIGIGSGKRFGTNYLQTNKALNPIVGMFGL